MKSHKIYNLKNGLTLIICDYPNFNSVYFDLLIKVGSRYENKNNNGISHLVEHLIFDKVLKNTKKHFWIKDYFNEDFKAYTSRERTNYEFSLHKKDLDLGVKLLSRIIKTHLVEIKKIKTEKNVVLNEILKDKDDLNLTYYKKKIKTIFTKSSLAFDILGTKKSLDNIKQKDIKIFTKKYYSPENCILTVAGNVNHKKIIKLLNEKIKCNNSKINFQENINKQKQNKDKLFFIKEKTNQNYFGYHSQIFNLDAKEIVKYEFFVEILNLYLSDLIRKKINCYLIDASLITYSDFFLFSIEASFDYKNTLNFYKEFQNILAEFKNQLSLKDFNYLKQKKIINLDLNKDYPRENANLLAWSVFVFGAENNVSINKQKEIIKGVSLNDIYKYFDESFKNKKGTVIFGGKNFNKEKLKKIWNNWKI